MTLNLNELSRGGTQCFSKAGLAISASPTHYLQAAPNGAGVDYAINGIMYHIADSADITPTAAAAQGLLSTCIYLVCGNTSSALVTVKGVAKLNADLTAGNAVLDWPTPAVDTCPIGAIKVQTLTSGDFTMGTTALTPAATLAVTYYDLTLLPAAPLTS
jgi:hypothetical protein